MSRRESRRGRSFAERNVKVYGYVGTAILLALLLAALNFTKLPFLNSHRSYAAQFSELGGLNSGDDVEAAGVVVGSVDSVSLTVGRAHPYVTVHFSITDGNVHLGSATTASVSTVTLLGRKALAIQSRGVGTMPAGATIPLSRTVAPFDITDDLQGLTGKIQSIDTTALVKALNTVSDTFGDTAVPLRAALEGLGRVSTTISSRDAALRTLLRHASNVTGVLASRNQQIDLLLTDGATLFADLTARRQVIDTLFRNVSAVTAQLTGLTSDQKSRLKPALTALTTVLGQLNASRVNLAKIINGLAQYATELGDAVGSGPFFDAYIANLTEPGNLPFDPTNALGGILSGLNVLAPLTGAGGK